MKKILLTIITTAIAGVFNYVTAQSDIQFDKIRVTGASSVTLKQSEKHSMIAESETGSGPSNIFKTEPGGLLVITAKGGDKITVTAPSISSIDLTGTGSLKTDGLFKTEQIKLTVSGVGKLETELEATRINTIISGSGKVVLSGTADELQIDISGSGKVDAESLKVKTCTANISGSGKCLVDVSDVLNANISGSGNIYHVKTPAVINRNISGVGKIGDANVSLKDTTRITMGKKKVLIVDDKGRSARQGFKEMIDPGPGKVKSHWAGFELGLNMLVDESFNTNPPTGYEFLDLKTEKSIAVNFNLFDIEARLYKRHIMLVTGLGVTFNNYRFKSDSYLIPGADSVVAISDPLSSIKKNKLTASYLTVPLLIEFNTSQNPSKTVHLAVGVIGGLRMGSHLKLVKESEGKEVKTKYRNDFNLNPWRYDATVRFGFRNYTLFGSYNLAGLFKNDKGPDLNTFTAGIRLVGW
jgi:hypothetical protein